MKNFLNINSVETSLLKAIITGTIKEKKLDNKNIGCIYELPSTRTRLSFIKAINELGANPIDIDLKTLNLSRYESFEDTFKIFNCYLDGLVFRTNSHSKLDEASKFFNFPIINALSEISHPCQIIADLITLYQKFNSLNIKIYWFGDINNVCFSLIEAVSKIKEIQLMISSSDEIIDSKKNLFKDVDNIFVKNSIDYNFLKQTNCVMTDVFESMNDQKDIEKIESLKIFKIDQKLMSETKNDCVFMHCLPTNYQEVEKEVVFGSKSLVIEQAKNRTLSQVRIMQSLDW